MVTTPISADTARCALCADAIQLDVTNHLRVTGAIPPADPPDELEETPELLVYYFHDSCTGGNITGRVDRKAADRCDRCGGQLTRGAVPLTVTTAVARSRGGDSSPLAGIDSYPVTYHRDCFEEIRADWTAPE